MNVTWFTGVKTNAKGGVDLQPGEKQWMWRDLRRAVPRRRSKCVIHRAWRFPLLCRRRDNRHVYQSNWVLPSEFLFQNHWIVFIPFYCVYLRLRPRNVIKSSDISVIEVRYVFFQNYWKLTLAWLSTSPSSPSCVSAPRVRSVPPVPHFDKI
jgi:hypothetical protein